MHPKHLLHYQFPLQRCLKIDDLGVWLQRENDSAPGSSFPDPNLPFAEPYGGKGPHQPGARLRSRSHRPRPGSQKPQRSCGLAGALSEEQIAQGAEARGRRLSEPGAAAGSPDSAQEGPHLSPPAGEQPNGRPVSPAPPQGAGAGGGAGLPGGGLTSRGAAPPPAPPPSPRG